MFNFNNLYRELTQVNFVAETEITNTVDSFTVDESPIGTFGIGNRKSAGRVSQQCVAF
mgnify:CR=1 FL=1